MSRYHRFVVNDWRSVMGNHLVVRSLVMDDLSMNNCLVVWSLVMDDLSMNNCLVVRYHSLMVDWSLVDNSCVVGDCCLMNDLTMHNSLVMRHRLMVYYSLMSDCLVCMNWSMMHNLVMRRFMDWYSSVIGGCHMMHWCIWVFCNNDRAVASSYSSYSGIMVHCRLLDYNWMILLCD